MPKYMLLLYADSPTPEEQEVRESQNDKWRELHRNLEDAGLFLASGRLHPVVAATTVRVRDEETEVLDGPFAITKEHLGGYILIECADLDTALAQAARVPLARYGSVEVRPVMDEPLPPRGGATDEVAAAS
jgi:hypothetical protein